MELLAVVLKPVSSLDRTETSLVRNGQQSVAVFPKHFLLADPFGLRKITTNSYILLHLKYTYIVRRYIPELIMYIPELS
jgi:hypothetical protein